MDLARLAEPFPPEDVSFRVGSTSGDKSKGMALAYIDARDVHDRLNAVCGPAGWQCDFPWSDGKRVTCRIGIKVGDEWIWKADGAGETDYEGEKGAFSDAFKRAAVKWGVGQYLYGWANKWAAIEPQGKSYRFTKDALSTLQRMLPRPAGTRAAAPEPVPQQAPAPSTDAMHRTAHEIQRGTIADAKDISDMDVWLAEHGDRVAAMPQPFADEIFVAAIRRGFELSRTVQEFTAWRTAVGPRAKALSPDSQKVATEARDAAMMRFKNATREIAA